MNPSNRLSRYSHGEVGFVASVSTTISKFCRSSLISSVPVQRRFSLVYTTSHHRHLRSLHRCTTIMADTLGNANSPTVEDDPLIQYVIVRKDLLEEPFSWPLGSVISQGVHAAVAAISAFDSKMYCAQRYGVCIDSVKVLGDDAKDEDAKPIPQFPLVQMRTVTLEVKDEKSLLQIASRLKENQVHFALWNEMPERIPTALATSPDHKSKIFPFVKKLRLFK